MSKLVLNEMSAAPDTPSTGKAAIYVNTTPALCVKDDAGAVTVLPAYATGTWTPVLKFGATTVAGVSANNATYATIGPMCFINATLILTAKNGTGVATIAGLPFTSGAGFWSGQFGYYEALTSSPSMLLATVAGSTTVISLYVATSGVTTAAMQDTDFSTTTTLVLSLAYRMA